MPWIIAILVITGFLILLYLVYPLWLMIFKLQDEKESEKSEITGVSLVLLSYNGKKYLEDKVDFLIHELSALDHHELIIIDDGSIDGSQEVLSRFIGDDHVKIILKKRRKGIPDSMNMAVNMAKYGYVVFCDQRQKLTGNIILRLVQPLRIQGVGAVSACIYHLDQQDRYSMIRKLENFIKCLESKAGSLIGVYGPLYAIRKDSYCRIPENIILDDLYLSLQILKRRHILLLEDCRIIDENFSSLNDYKRARRYLSGFLQIMKEKSLIRDLRLREKIMLVWHKYLRLLIPVFLFLCYVCSGFLAFHEIKYLPVFFVFTMLGFFSLMPVSFRFKNLIRINILYLVAMADVFIKDVILQRKPADPVINLDETGN